MSYNFDGSNNSSIIIKKSLQKTIRKIEKAITLINEDYSRQISDLTLVESLGKNSDILLNYLENNNVEQYFINDNELPQQKPINRPNPLERIREDNRASSFPNNTPSYNSQQKKFNNKFNLIISIALIISLCFNIYTFFWQRHFTSAGNLNNQKEEILLKDVQGEKQDNQTGTLDSNQENINSTEEIENIEKPIIIEGDNIPQMEEESSPEDISPNNIKVIPPEAEIVTNNQDLKVTAAMDLLTTIENQLRKITDSYENNLISRIEPKYDDNSITMIVNDNWQKIEVKKQQELSKKIFKKVKAMDFYRFQLKDIHGNLIARNAAIGDKLIIIGK